jgi:hypothetical protein
LVNTADQQILAITKQLQNFVPICSSRGTDCGDNRRNWKQLCSSIVFGAYARHYYDTVHSLPKNISHAGIYIVLHHIILYYCLTTHNRQRISKVKEGTHRRSRKWDVTKLKNPDIKNKHEKNIDQKLNGILVDQSPDIELEWDNLKNIINDVASDKVGIRINTKNVGRFDEDCRKAIKVKNEARKKRLIRDTSLIEKNI